MALSDYPQATIKWDTGLEPVMLQALGNLAVVSAQAEELLHQIYWNHAGLNAKTGPIVTDNLNPKRLEEDITKLVELDKSKANVLADLKILFEELRALNTKRNHCLHWIWKGRDRDDPESASHLLSVPVSVAYKLDRPIYRQSGTLTQEFSVEDVQGYCKQFAWLSYRLRSHTFSDAELRVKRNETLTQNGLLGKRLVDLFWPAPWLDKPLPLEATPKDRPEIQK